MPVEREEDWRVVRHGEQFPVCAGHSLGGEGIIAEFVKVGGGSSGLVLVSAHVPCANE